jgi:hypothetical protein
LQNGPGKAVFTPAAAQNEDIHECAPLALVAARSKLGA